MQAVTRDHNKVLEKKPIATGLTPEVAIGERAALRNKAKQHHVIVKTTLLKQMDKKQQIEENERRQMIEVDNLERDDNNKTMEQQKLKKKQLKIKEQEHWAIEIERELKVKENIKNASPKKERPAE